MSLRSILTMELWRWRASPWLLLILAAPSFVAQFWIIPQLPSGHPDSNWALRPFCLFMSAAPAVWGLAALWFVVDVFLVAWVSRALKRQSEPARPASLFFLWQGAKFSFFVLYFAVMFSSRPFEPLFHFVPS